MRSCFIQGIRASFNEVKRRVCHTGGECYLCIRHICYLCVQSIQKVGRGDVLHPDCQKRYQQHATLKVTQKTAWFLLQHIREACQREEFKLALIVEVDEVYIGGKNKNRHLKDRPKLGQGMVGKQTVLGLYQRRGPTKALPVDQTDMATLYPVIQQHVEAGAFVCTDDHGAYRGLNQLGYQHRAVASAGEYLKNCAHTNGIESVWAVLKRSLLGVYHWVSVKHLARYLNEATFVWSPFRRPSRTSNPYEKNLQGRTDRCSESAYSGFVMNG